MARRRLSFEGKDVCIPPKPEVLIVVGSNGLLEVYTSRYMRVCIAKRLTGLPDTIEAELASEEYLEQRLPQWAREIYYPGHLQKRDTVRLLRPSEEMERRTALEIVRECMKGKDGQQARG